MLYILLNNTYHITDLEKYLNTETVSQITYITVPVQLDSSLIRLPNIQLPAINVKELIRNYWAAKYKIAQIKKSIKPNNDDTLIVFSEIQLSNQIVIQEFSKAKAKVFLIEDGTATPILFNTQLQGSDAKSILLKFFLQYVIGFPDIRVTNHDNGYFYHMADKIFSGVIQFSEYSIKRNIKQYKLHSRPTALSFSKNTNNCIFFNQHLYQVYVDFETFMHELDKIINALVKKFDKVYFKFHPNEKREDVVKIKKILSQKYVIEYTDIKNNVDLISLNLTYGVSFISTVLRELNYYGLKPIYLYHLFPNLCPVELNDNYTNYLNQSGYSFLPSLEELEIYCETETFFKTIGSTNSIELFNIDNCIND